VNNSDKGNNQCIHCVYFATRSDCISPALHRSRVIRLSSEALDNANIVLDEFREIFYTDKNFFSK